MEMVKRARVCFQFNDATESFKPSDSHGIKRALLIAHTIDCVSYTSASTKQQNNMLFYFRKGEGSTDLKCGIPTVITLAYSGTCISHHIISRESKKLGLSLKNKNIQLDHLQFLLEQLVWFIF